MMVGYRYKLKLYNNGELTYKTSTGKRKRIYLKIRGLAWTEANLEVIYFRNDVPIGSNAGTYTTVDSAIQALEAFTESEVVQ